MDFPSCRAARGTWVRALAALALVGAASSGCHGEAPLPPDVSGFRITDKFFDVKSLGDKTYLLLGYRSVVSKSTDGGATWKQVAQPSKRSMTRLRFLDGKKGFGVGHEGMIWATDDAGEHWTDRKSGTKESLFDLDFPSPNVGWVVGDKSTYLRTTDGGQTWTASNIPICEEGKPCVGVREDMTLAIEDPIFYSTSFVDDNTGWVVGEFGQIRFTQDGGQNWDQQHRTLVGARYRDVMSMPTFLCIRMRDRSNGIAVGTYGSIASTSDGGANWKLDNSPVPTPLYDIRVMPDGDYVIVGSSGVILRGNPEKGWGPAKMPPGVFTWISAVDFDPQGNGVAVGAHGLILTSKDFGQNWEWKVNG